MGWGEARTPVRPPARHASRLASLGTVRCAFTVREAAVGHQLLVDLLTPLADHLPASEVHMLRRVRDELERQLVAAGCRRTDDGWVA